MTAWEHITQAMYVYACSSILLHRYALPSLVCTCLKWRSSLLSYKSLLGGDLYPADSLSSRATENQGMYLSTHIMIVTRMLTLRTSTTVMHSLVTEVHAMKTH
jgi:hypothetical protein